MSTSYFVILEVCVEDPDSLYMAAMHQATRVDGMDRTDAQDILQPDPEGGPDISACLIMLLDPGQSPAGTSIIQSSVE